VEETNRTMIAHPLISMPKEFTPPHAAPTAPAASGGFAKLLDPDGIVHLNQNNSSQSTSTTPVTSPAAPKPKAVATTDASAASAAVVVPAPIAPVQAPPLKPVDATIAAAATATQAAAAATEAASSATPAQTAAAEAKAPTGNGTVTNNQSTQLPPEAALLGARVAAGVPNYLSQPNSVLAGLWHHGGDAVGASDGAAGGDDKAAAADDDAPGQNAATLKLGAASVLSVEARQDAGDSVAAATDTDTHTADAPDAASGDPAPGANFVLPQSSDQNSVPTPAATSTAPAAPPTHTLPVFEQVAFNLKQAAQNGSDHIEIQLKPASLGVINVKLDVSHDGRITAVISADRSDTLHMLRQDASGLQQALRDAGLQADSGSLSFNLRGDAQSFAQNQSGPQSGGGGASQATTASTASIADAQNLRRHDGALDIQV
jgi:flagellar hook-length control protein FliK